MADSSPGLISGEYGSVYELFARAEAYTKAASIAGHREPIASINELRYVGKHVLGALSHNGDGDAYAEHMAYAVHHCIRAMNDALDAAMYEFIIEFDNFCHDFRDVPVSGVLPEYLEMHCMVDQMRVRAMQAANWCRNTEFDPEEEVLLTEADLAEVDCKIADLEKMQEFRRKMPVAREELLKSIHARKVKFAQWLVIVLISVATIAAMVVLGIYQLSAN